MDESSPKEKVWVECPMCRHDDAQVLFTRDDYQHVRCRNCDLIYVNPRRPDELQLNADLYGRTHPAWSGISERFRAMEPSALNEQLDLLRRRPPKKYLRELGFMKAYRRTGRFLDVGCADGRFLLAADGQGWSVSGVEVAPESASLSSEVFGLDVRCGILEDAQFEDGTFDVARLNQVIEHVAAPVELLREIRRVLRPGGLLSLATINIKSFSFSILGSEWSHLGSSRNEHVVFFSKKTLELVLGLAGFTCVKWKTVGCRLRDRGTLGDRFHERGIRMAEKMIGHFAKLMGRGGRIHVYAQSVEAPGRIPGRHAADQASENS